MNVAIVTAAGSGKRLPGSVKKQYLLIAGKPLLYYSLLPFVTHSQIQRCIVTVPADEIEPTKQLIDSYFTNCNIDIIIGGTERQDSVRNGLDSCPAHTEYVLIHDGVRPFIKETDITVLLEKASQTNAAIPASFVKHTIKRVDGTNVTDTLPRQDLVQVYTPQVFYYPLVHQCHQQAFADHFYGTDDASLLEHYGYPVSIVLMSDKNIKVTDALDLQLVSWLIEHQDNLAF